MITSTLPVVSKQQVQRVIKGGYITCQQYHGGLCQGMAFERMLATMHSMYKIYLPIHLIPFLIFKRKRLLENPKKQLLKLLKDYCSSVLFAGGYMGLLGLMICYVKQLTNYGGGKYSLSTGAFVGGLALLFESSSRQQEIALFVVPKFFEAVYLLIARRGLIPRKFNYSHIVFGLTMAIICYYYQTEKSSIKPSYLSAFQKVIGDV